jgi:broad specificity phosphatase PhoE
MMPKHLTMILWFSLALSAFSPAPSLYAATDIYFVRHAETMGNLTHRHNQKNDRTLSPKGLRQVKALTRKLDILNFDYIVVSPKYRALKTILPYLKKHRRVAEVWPELAECCWQKQRELSAGMPRRGSQIRLETAMKPYFTFARPEDRFNFHTRSYGQGILQTFMAAEKIKKRFAGSGKRILVVGHYHAGSRLIEILQGNDPVGRYKISNTQLLHLRENINGTFALLSYP